jgi:hypothetical protein
VAQLDIAVTPINLGGECRTREIFSGRDGREQFFDGQNGVEKVFSSALLSIY